jgi:hypothetical protein
MVNNNSGNGKKIEVNLTKENQERIREYSLEQDRSINSIVNESVENHMDKCKVKQLISDACKSGDLREESRACKYTEEHSEHE